MTQTILLNPALSHLLVYMNLANFERVAGRGSRFVAANAFARLIIVHNTNEYNYLNFSFYFSFAKMLRLAVKKRWLILGRCSFVE